MMRDSSKPPALFDEEQKKNFVHEQDYEYSRDTYYDLIEKGRESLELMIEVARESEHPHNFLSLLVVLLTPLYMCVFFSLLCVYFV